jgi:hypothetical protein
MDQAANHWQKHGVPKKKSKNMFKDMTEYHFESLNNIAKTLATFRLEKLVKREKRKGAIGNYC